MLNKFYEEVGANTKQEKRLALKLKMASLIAEGLLAAGLLYLLAIGVSMYV